jgi:hypothetical protein
MATSAPGWDNLIQMLSGQIMTMTSMRNGDIWSAIQGIILLNLFNSVVKVVPIVYKQVLDYIAKYMDKKNLSYSSALMSVANSSSTTTKERKGTIIYEKPKDVNGDQTVILALIAYISNLSTSKIIVYNLEYYVANDKEFVLKPDIYCRVIKFERDDKGKVTDYQFEIYSYAYDIEYLKDFSNGIIRDYQQERANNLGKQAYFFNEMPLTLPRDPSGGYRFEVAQKHLCFDMTPFHTNKSLKNVFGEHLNIVKRRVDMFINNPRWYEEKGIPYTLGILLSGPPGTGKTSLIKAIAKDTKRHIFNISLRETSTQSQLKALFYNTEVRILRNGVTESIQIPHDKRIYVLEDVDCLTDVVIDRELLWKQQIEQSAQGNDSDEGTAESQLIVHSLLSVPEREVRLMDSRSSVGVYDKSAPHDTVCTGLQDQSNAIGVKQSQSTNIGDILKATRGRTVVSNVDRLLTTLMNNENNGSSQFESPFTNIERNSLDDMFNSTLTGNGSASALDKQFGQANLKEQDKNKEQKKKQASAPDNPEKLNLSFLLNLLDGVLETPGRIIIMTSNHPEKLDKALIRPGRIDIALDVSYCSRDMIIDMCRYFYENKDFFIPEEEWAYTKQITPAEMNKIMLNNFDDIKKCTAELLKQTR